MSSEWLSNLVLLAVDGSIAATAAQLPGVTVRFLTQAVAAPESAGLTAGAV